MSLNAVLFTQLEQYGLSNPALSSCWPYVRRMKTVALPGMWQGHGGL